MCSDVLITTAVNAAVAMRRRTFQTVATTSLINWWTSYKDLSVLWRESSIIICWESSSCWFDCQHLASSVYYITLCFVICKHCCDDCININCMSLSVTLTGESIGIDRIFVWGSCKFSLFTSFALDITVCSACLVFTRFIPNNFLMGLDWESRDPFLASPLCESSHVRTLSRTLLHTNCKWHLSLCCVVPYSMLYL